MIVIVTLSLILFTFAVSTYLLPFVRRVMHTEEASTSLINQPNFNSPNKDHTAIVIGSSISGLFAATTLSKHFKKVIILEQKRIPVSSTTDGSGLHMGTESIVPQGEQIHLLLDKGQQILDKMFPGSMKELLNRGALLVDYSQLDMYMKGGRRPKVEFGDFDLNLKSMTRGLLEGYIREQVTKISNIEILDDCCVTGLLFDSTDPRRIRGVQVGSSGTSMEADLIVDCGGISTKTLKWIVEKLKPQSKESSYKTTVRSHISYCTVIANMKEGKELGFREGVPQLIRYTMQIYPSQRAALSYRVEDNKAALLFQTLNKLPLPNSVESALTFAKGEQESMASVIRDYFDAIDMNDAIKFKEYKKDGSVYNHFERFKLKGFIALGDSVASFNPVLGQGISTAGEACLVLDRMLRSTSKSIDKNDTFCSDYQTAYWYLSIFPWILATTSDLRYKKTEGGGFWFRKLVLPVLAAVLDRFFSLGHDSKFMYYQFVCTLMMKTSYPYILYQPKVLFTLITGYEFPF